MITVTFQLNGTTQVQDFDSKEAWEHFYDQNNPSDNPFTLEIIDKYDDNKVFICVTSGITAVHEFDNTSSSYMAMQKLQNEDGNIRAISVATDAEIGQAYREGKLFKAKI